MPTKEKYGTILGVDKEIHFCNWKPCLPGPDRILHYGKGYALTHLGKSSADSAMEVWNMIRKSPRGGEFHFKVHHHHIGPDGTPHRASGS